MFALIYYAVDARKWFKGPRVNVEHLIYGQPGENSDSITDNAENLTEKS